jgi:nucleoid DNA-binding protein
MVAKTDSSRAAAERAVNAPGEIISDTLKKGDSLTLPGFGTFEVLELLRALAAIPRQAKNSRSPQPKFGPSNLAPPLELRSTGRESKG